MNEQTVADVLQIAEDVPRPRIAITLEHELDARFGHTVTLCNDYAEAIWAVGGIPWPVPYTTKHSHFGSILRQVDGLILTGGEDIDPRLYNEEIAGSINVDRERDDHEWKLLKLALSYKLPVLGICRGYQLINIYRGGSLHQHIEGHRQGIDQSLQEPMHPVKLAGYFAQMYNRKEINVNSYHHQAIKQLGKGLTPLAWDPEERIEGYVSEDGMILGVQWHPEIMVDTHQEELAPFRWLVKRAQRHREERKIEKYAKLGIPPPPSAFAPKESAAASADTKAAAAKPAEPAKTEKAAQKPAETKAPEKPEGPKK